MDKSNQHSFQNLSLSCCMGFKLNGLSVMIEMLFVWHLSLFDACTYSCSSSRLFGSRLARLRDLPLIWENNQLSSHIFTINKQNSLRQNFLLLLNKTPFTCSAENADLCYSQPRLWSTSNVEKAWGAGEKARERTFSKSKAGLWDDCQWFLPRLEFLKPDLY